MRARTKAIILNILGMLLCVVPAVLATLEHFPIWISEGETVVSGLTAVLLIICALPFKRQITEYLRSPSAWVIWLCIFIFSALLGKIVDDIAAIALVAFPTNLLGAAVFKLRDKYKENS